MTTPQKIAPTICNIQPDPLKFKQRMAQPEGNHKFQRLLNYEMDQINTKKAALHEIKLPGKVLISAYAQQTVIATPMTAAMEMYNWLQEKHSQFKKFLKQGILSIEKISQEYPDLIPSLSGTKKLKQYDICFEKTVEQAQQLGLMDASMNKRSLYWTFYLRFLEEYLNYILDEKVIQNQAQSLLVVAIESVNFILGFQNNSLEQLSSNLVQYDIWEALDFLLNNFDPKCPIQLKSHILDVETRYISNHIWSGDSQLMQFLQNSQQIQQSPNNQFQRVFKRVLHYSAYQIQILCSQLKLNDQVSETVWQTSKYIFSEKLSSLKKQLLYKLDLLQNRSLDQIVLSCIYAVLKMIGNPSKFQLLINTFEQQNSHYSKQFLKKIMTQIWLGAYQYGDIVQFYNQIFIPATKLFLIQISQQLKSNKGGQQTGKSSPFVNKNPALTQQLLQSPLKSILPINSTPQNKAPGLMTPSTQLLYAYTESPLLKATPKLQKENNPYNSVQKHINPDLGNNTTEFIMKKFQQIKENKNTTNLPQQNNPKSIQSFSIFTQGTPRIINSSRNNISTISAQNQSNVSFREKTQESNVSSNYQKLLNFE